MILKRRGGKTLIEPPSVMLTDLAFNLVIFFVVCASTEPESGRRQAIPRSSKDESAATSQQKNLEIALTRTTIAINGIVTPLDDFSVKMGDLLRGKTRTEDRMVVLKTTKDTPYRHWIRVASLIENAGGIIALQVEETREVNVK